MRFVVDASVAVKWLIAEDGADIADRTTDRWSRPARNTPDGF